MTLSNQLPTVVFTPLSSSLWGARGRPRLCECAISKVVVLSCVELQCHDTPLVPASTIPPHTTQETV